jgi:hypothetical protein
VADWLSRAPSLDGYCPDDGEMEKEKYRVDDAGNLQFVDSVDYVAAVAGEKPRRQLQTMSADQKGARTTRKPTAYSVCCAGIGSCMQAIERFNILATVIGCCEVNHARWPLSLRRRTHGCQTMATCGP